jgi:hypothetical protein
VFVVPIGQEVGWAKELIWIWWWQKRKKSAPVRIQTQATTLPPGHYADYAISVHTNTTPNYFACATLSELPLCFLNL